MKNQQAQIKHLDALQFEMTTACNLTCIMCPQVNSAAFKSRKKGYMDFSLFRKIIADITQAGIHFNAIFPFWLGESLMHPKFPKFYQHLMENNFANSLFNCIEFDTNAHFLTSAMSEHLLSFQAMQSMSEQTFQRIYFSIDSVHPTTYQTIRGSSDLQLVLDNITTFLTIREERKLTWPKISLQMVIQDDNYDEISSFCEYFQELWHSKNLNMEFFYALNKDSFSKLASTGDCVFLRPLYTSAVAQPDADQKYLAAIAKSSIPLKRITSESEDSLHFGVSHRELTKQIGSCHYLMTRPLITIEGDLLPCFNDESCSISLGNLTNSDFLSLWLGEKAEKLRRDQQVCGATARCVDHCQGYVPFHEPQDVKPKNSSLILHPEQDS